MTFHSPTSNDDEVVQRFQRIANALGQDSAQCRIGVNVMEGYTRNPGETTLAELPDLPFVQLARDNPSATWHDVRVHFDPLHLRVRLERNREAGFDVIQVRYDDDPTDPADIRRSLAAVQSQFIPLNHSEAIERALGPELAEFYRLREAGLSRLETLNRKLVEETHDYRLRLDAENAEQKKALDATFDERRRELDASYGERATELEARAKELDQQRQELDDRSARHARREQSRALQKKISDRSEKFTLTPETQQKRKPIHRIFQALLLTSGGLIAWALLAPPTAVSGAELWLQLVRLPIGVLGFGVTSVFYIRWNDRWFRQHADQEFRLQQLALDVDRAGYAAEMLLEWQEDKGGEMPAVLVDRLTTGLFTDQTTVARARHPTEDIAGALLKASSSVRLDLPGIGEVNLTGRQIRGLDKKLAGQGE